MSKSEYWSYLCNKHVLSDPGSQWSNASIFCSRAFEWTCPIVSVLSSVSSERRAGETNHVKSKQRNNHWLRIDFRSKSHNDCQVRNSSDRPLTPRTVRGRSSRQIIVWRVVYFEKCGNLPFWHVLFLPLRDGIFVGLKGRRWHLKISFQIVQRQETRRGSATGRTKYL